MLEEIGNIWDKKKEGYVIVVTTNGFVKKNGTAVMGRGIAREAAGYFPELPKLLGEQITLHGNRIHYFTKLKLFCFPVKRNWWEKGDMLLIQQSARNLAITVEAWKIPAPIYLPRPGCGNGQLDWANVKPILQHELNDNFISMTFYPKA